MAIDTRKLLKTLKATGKSANFTAEEIAAAFDVAQEGAELLTRSEFRVQMDGFSARMDAMAARFDAKLEAVRGDIKAEVKASHVQNLMWLSGIVSQATAS